MVPEIETLLCPGVTPPHGHYCHATRHRDTLYVSGLLGNSLPEHVDAQRSMRTQAAHCLDALSAILAHGGSSLEGLLKLSVYVSDVEEWPDVDSVLAARLGHHKPARIVVPTGATLRFNSRIELDAIAALSG